MKKIVIFLVIISSLTSCISNKKTTYYQGEPSSRTDLYKLNNEPYRLQVNDILFIDLKAEDPALVTLFKKSEASEGGTNAYFSGYTVDRHGNIRIPNFGEINVLGYTEDEIRKKVEAELLKYLKDEKKFYVTVKLAGINFIVHGEVSTPGSKNLAQNQVTIIDAIANSGEISEFGDLQNVQILRKTLDGVKKYTIDMTRIDIFDSEHFYIKPNDIIYVPAVKQKSWGTGTTGLQTFTTITSIMAFVVSSVLLVKNI